MKNNHFFSLSTILTFLLLLLPGVAAEQKDKPVNPCDLKSQTEVYEYIGQRAIALYTELNQCSKYRNVAQREALYIPGGDWEIKWDEQTKTIDMIRLNKNITPSSALYKIFKNTDDKNILECALAFIIIRSIYICEIISEAAFNDIYSKREKYYEEMSMPSYSLNSFSNDYLGHDKLAIKTLSQQGMFVSFRNFPNYMTKNPFGIYSNDNLVSVLDQGSQSIKYVGFGEGFAHGVLSYDEVITYLLKAYNVGSNKIDVAKVSLDLNSFLKELGFREVDLYNKAKTYVLKNHSTMSTFSMNDDSLKKELLSCIQELPFSVSSLDINLLKQ